jgi:hypothetical protein
MGNEVYANGNEIACKAGMGKVIASFPDVCLTPPPPPAGPIPVPYPDSSFSKDTQNGSKTVKIGGDEVMLKDQSFYKSSPLGDEPATQGQGANVITHVITGKTYFTAWSMDVKFEGQNVDRHIDITTSNHASMPPGCPTPNPNLDAMAFGDLENTYDQCACCGMKPKHSSGAVMTMDEWYTKDNFGNTAPHAGEYTNLMAEVNGRKSATPPCTCSSKLVPSQPCNVFRRPVSGPEYDKIVDDWDDVRPVYQAHNGIPSVSVVTANLTASLGHPPTQAQVQDERQVNHLTPKKAGGCSNGDGNLEKNGSLCSVCRGLDKKFGNLQRKIALMPT